MFMGNIKKRFLDFINEGSNLDSNQLLDNVELLKNKFSDYREVLDFFSHIEGEFYGKDNPVVGIGFTIESLLVVHLEFLYLGIYLMICLKVILIWI